MMVTLHWDTVGIRQLEVMLVAYSTGAINVIS